MRLLHPTARDVADDELPDLYDHDRPMLRAGFVGSLDGSVAVDGRSRALSGPADLAVFRALRTVADAVLVGGGTARAEDYGPVLHSAAARQWRAMHGRSPQALLVVITRTGRLPLRALAGPLLVVAPEATAVPEGVDVLRAGGESADLAEAVHQLQERGLTRLLCEGGPSLLRDLLDTGLVDELCLTCAPALVGAGPRLVEGLARPVAVELEHLLHDAPGPLLGRWRVVRSADGPGRLD